MTINNENNVNNINPTAIRASLAPMAGFTDSVFRRLCSDYGAAEVTSEMISSVALTMNDRKTGTLAAISVGEAPAVLQIFGHDPDTMARAADILLSGDFAGCSYATSPAGIDINMGCPVKKIFSSGDGSALMRDTPLAERIVDSVKDICEKHGVPLSVKFRLGVDEAHINYCDFGVALARAGADKITLHCRTRSQFYAPSAQPAHCGNLHEALSEAGVRGRVILAGNGDIETYADAARYIALGCDEVAVGRGALGDPWLFTALSAPERYVPPTIDDRIATVKQFVSDVVALRGEVCGIRESRSRAAYFIRDIRGAAQIRDRMNRAENLCDFLAILDEI
ncbi:MAG: tRNA-dihydrouridine synthase family protein [Ruminococcaceae bacterium]|nr:tRNA-dihydrouridine synthase family protein [Oscillospiraceae bacterium]